MRVLSTIVAVATAGCLEAPVLERAEPRPCSITDANTILCLELDDHDLSTTLDSSPARHDVSVTDVTSSLRDVPTWSYAAHLGADSKIVVSDGTDFDTQAVTMMAWVRREATPGTNQKYAIVDVLGQYGMNITTAGDLDCGIVSAQNGRGYTFTPQPTTTLGEWNLIACSYGTGRWCGTVFPGGVGPGTSACVEEHAGVGIAGHGATIGWTTTNPTWSLIGELDSVFVVGRFLAPDQICKQAGLPGC